MNKIKWFNNNRIAISIGEDKFVKIWNLEKKLHLFLIFKGLQINELIEAVFQSKYAMNTIVFN